MKRAAILVTLFLLAQPVMAATSLPEHVVIVDGQAGRGDAAKLSQTPNVSRDGYWTPTEAQAKKAYSALALGLHDPNLRTTNWADRYGQAILAKTLDTYEVTIVGVTARAGSDQDINGQAGAKMIDLQGICPEEKKLWGRGGPIIADGGNCFFSARYDPQSNKIIFFAFNGN